MAVGLTGTDFGAGRGVSRRKRWLRTALLSTVSLYATAAYAVDATWVGGNSPDPQEWQQDNNWTPATPDGTATFGSSPNTTVQNDLGTVTIGAINFTAAAPAYTLNLDNNFIVNGAGVNNSSALGQTFNVNATGVGSVLIFQNSASANSGVGSVQYKILGGGTAVFQNSSSAGNANTSYINNGLIQFYDTSTAGSSQITNNIETDFFGASTLGSATINNQSGLVTFNDTSTAGSGTISNAGGTVLFGSSSSAGTAQITNSSDATVNFTGNSTAGGSTINNNGTNIAINFSDNASAGTATINTSIAQFTRITFNNSSTAGGTTAGTGAHIHLIDASLVFNNSSNAGGATIDMTNLQHPGNITFNNTSSAANATITNVASTSLGGGVTFLDQSTAGAATINNNANVNDPVGGGQLTFGTLGGTDTADAGTAHINNNGDGAGHNGFTNFLASTSAANATITNTTGGSTSFQDQSTAANATIINNGGSLAFGVPIVGTDTATAGNASITNNSGGTTQFYASTTAGDATITTNAGGNVSFFDASSGGAARFITNAGGTFDISGLTVNSTTAGSIEGAGSYILGDKRLVVGSNNLSTEVSGVISGNNGITKVGTGTLTLSGIDTYLGSTALIGGTLVVNGTLASAGVGVLTATLTGTGTVRDVTLNPNATFRPGNGTAGSSMHLTGNFSTTTNAIFAVNINPTLSSFALVDGTATGGGTKVDATFANGGYIAKQYTILTALGGVQNGLFSGGVINHNFPPGFIETLSYDATHAYLNLAFAPPTAPGGSLSTNQQNVFNGINNSFNTVGQVPIAFGNLTAAGLTQLSGEVSTGFSTVAFQAGNSFLNLMLSPFVDGRFGPTGGAVPYAAEKPPHAAEAAFASAMPTKAAKVASFDDRYSVWGAAFGATGSVKGDPVVGSNRTSDQFYGAAAGLDYKLTPDTLVGVALAGGGTHWSLDAGLGSGRSDMFQAGVYGITHLGAAYLSAAGAYSFHDVSTTRTVTVAGTDVLGASFRANVIGGRLEGGYRIGMPWFAVTPYGAVQVQSASLPAYGESATSGSNQFALNYSSKTVTTTRTELGARFDKSFILNGGRTFTLYGRAAWAHDSGNTRSASAIFQALPVSNFVVNGAKPAPDGALVTAGAEYKIGNGWSVLAKFDGEFSSTTALYAGSGAIKKVW